MAAPDSPTLDKAFQALAEYNDGSARALLAPIDEAVQAAVVDPGQRGALESRFIEALAAKANRPAREYACRQLAFVGTSRCVRVVASLLNDADLAHMARSTLEAIPDPEALKVLRDALTQTQGPVRVGIVQSLGMRRDEESIWLLSLLVREPDLEMGAAALWALGEIGTPKAAVELAQFFSDPPVRLRPVLADACLACGRRMVSEGRPHAAQSLLLFLIESTQPEHVRAAAEAAVLAAEAPPA